ncbi:response regulator [Pontibacter silvestris]|uniref:histidine kinase n=1 Tax=Pontibacter silvestris TaxID=2305183 RepID=A0ABW4WWP9_9BACT|nr:response regulator [Pontibacter silvestris]MCC9138835.1 response regulator [Pontibacter silvestris]
MEFIRQVIEENPNPIYVKNEQGRFVLANEAFAQVHGLNVATLLEKGTGDFDYSYERDLEVLEQKNTITLEELYKLENGVKVWFHTIKKAFTQPDGSRYLLSTSSDITEWKRALQKADSSAKAKELFLSNMSHEIRGPVNAILGVARLMKKNYLGKEQEEYLNVIMSIADNLLVLPNYILDFANIESGKIELASIPFDVTFTVRSVVRALALKAKERDLLLHFVEPSDTVPVVEGDPFRMSQILVILINNAIKFTKKGEITVTIHDVKASNKTAYIEFGVNDSGIGADRLRKAFDINRNEAGKATGLNSSASFEFTVCKSLVELQGGKIWLGSKTEHVSGNHVYFSLTFPVSKHIAAVQEKEQLVVLDQLSGLTILLAEDNPVNQLLATSQLQSWGVMFDIAYNGEEAVSKASSKIYDLILMDIQMPRMNGIEATARIRNESSLNKDTPIVAFTANVQQEKVDNYVSFGFTDCLFKPYHESKLYFTIARNTGRDPGAYLVDRLEPVKKEAALYDFSELGNMAEDALFIRKMQQLFIDTVPAQLDELSEAIQKEDWEAAAYTSHRLKSTYGNIKIAEAADAMRDIEALARGKGSVNSIKIQLDTARKVTDKVVAAFSKQLKL